MPRLISLYHRDGYQVSENLVNMKPEYRITEYRVRRYSEGHLVQPPVNVGNQQHKPLMECPKLDPFLVCKKVTPRKAKGSALCGRLFLTKGFSQVPTPESELEHFPHHHSPLFFPTTAQRWISDPEASKRDYSLFKMSRILDLHHLILSNSLELGRVDSSMT